MPECPQCHEPMDEEAAAFWAGEDPDNFDAEQKICNACYYEYALGTRTPSAEWIAHADQEGW